MRMLVRDNKGIDIEKVTATVKDLDNQFTKDYNSIQQEFESIINAHKEVSNPKEVEIPKEVNIQKEISNTKEDITKQIDKE